VANYLKKCCSCGQPKQNFFEYFYAQPSDFEKMSITNDVCLLLGADELNEADALVDQLDFRAARRTNNAARYQTTTAIMFFRK